MQLALLGLEAATGAYVGAPLSLNQIRQIVCEGTVRYEEATPNDKEPARGVWIFTPGSRKEFRPKPGAFLLAEYLESEAGGMRVYDNQQFYFEPVKDGKLNFAFVLDYKASGSLTLGAENSATGFINSKSHITELSCAIERK